MKCGNIGCPRNISGVCMENLTPSCIGYCCPECGSGWVVAGKVYHYRECSIEPKLPKDMYEKKIKKIEKFQT